MPSYDSVRFIPPAPVAQVVLRHPATGTKLPDVPLLIDCGADVTLLPQASLTALGIVPDHHQEFSLVGFDGTVSTSVSARVDLILHGKTFKGEFLLTEQAIGYLGRDVLNHLSTLLDGPKLLWEIR